MCEARDFDCVWVGTRVAAGRYCKAVLAYMPPHGQKPQMLRASRQCNCKGQSNHHNHNTRNLHYTPLQPHIRRCRRSFEFLPAASRRVPWRATRSYFSKLFVCKGLRFTEKLLKSGSKAARLTPYTQAATSTLERTEFLRWAEASPTPYFRTELRFWAACEGLPCLPPVVMRSSRLRRRRA